MNIHNFHRIALLIIERRIDDCRNCQKQKDHETTKRKCRKKTEIFFKIFEFEKFFQHLKPPLKKEVARSAGGFVETNFELEFVSLKSPVIALRAMPHSFSKRVFLTSFEKGGCAKRRRIFGRQTPIQSLSPKNHPSSHFVRCHPLFQRGFSNQTSFEKGGGAKRRRIFGRQTPIQSFCLPKITRHRTSCDATLFFKEGFKFCL